jgi:hypothetical protein
MILFGFGAAVFATIALEHVQALALSIEYMQLIEYLRIVNDSKDV